MGPFKIWRSRMTEFSSRISNILNQPSSSSLTDEKQFPPTITVTGPEDENHLAENSQRGQVGTVSLVQYDSITYPEPGVSVDSINMERDFDLEMLDWGWRWTLEGETWMSKGGGWGWGGGWGIGGLGCDLAA